MSAEKRMKGVGVKVLQVLSRLFFFDMECTQCLIGKKKLTEAVGRCPVVVLPVAVLED